LHEEFKRRIKTQTVLPRAETAAMLIWALLASDQSLAEKPSGQTIDRAARCGNFMTLGIARLICNRNSGDTTG
jgi:hypothetical protein